MGAPVDSLYNSEGEQSSNPKTPTPSEIDIWLEQTEKELDDMTKKREKQEISKQKTNKKPNNTTFLEDDVTR